MPICILECSGGWLPTDEMVLEMAKELRESDDMHSFTRSLLAELPEIIADCINEIDSSREPIEPGQVVVRPKHAHLWSENVSEFFLDIQPGNGGEELLFAQQMRRAALSNAISKQIELFVQPRQTKPHTFDVEVRPISSTGMTLKFEDGKCKVDGHWGYPKRYPVFV